MNTVFLLSFLACLICVPIFITMGLVNIIRRRPSKKRFKLAGVSALALAISLIGFGFTLEDDASSKESSSSSAEVPASSYALAENTPAKPSPTPAADLAPSPTPQPTPIPTPIPTEAPTPVPAVSPQQPEPSGNSNSTMVWIDDTAKRYHKKNGCGMDNAYQVTLEEALAKGKTPCGNCYR